MELNTLTPEMTELLRDMGISYDPERLSEALSSRQLELNARAVIVTAKLGGFAASVARVRRSVPDKAPGTRKTCECRDNSGSGAAPAAGQAAGQAVQILADHHVTCHVDLSVRPTSYPCTLGRDSRCCAMRQDPVT
jgi:hypothetical protein